MAALERLGVERKLFVDLVTSGDEAWQALAGLRDLAGAIRSQGRAGCSGPHWPSIGDGLKGYPRAVARSMHRDLYKDHGTGEEH